MEAPKSTLQYKQKGQKRKGKAPKRVVTVLPSVPSQPLPHNTTLPQNTKTQLLLLRTVLTHVTGFAPKPHRTAKDSKRGLPCFAPHLPSYAGVQEALEFLDVCVRRILHLESFL